LEQAYQIFHVRGLAGTSHGDIAYRYYRCVETAAFQNAQVEELVSDTHSETIEPAQWLEPFVDLYEIAFHDCF
jgi:hypothetical protein